jgi:hypothetical protein
LSFKKQKNKIQIITRNLKSYENNSDSIHSLWKPRISSDKHESNLRVLESLDIFETAERNPDQQYTGAGQLMMAEKDGIVGFELAMDEYIVHAAIFSK